MTTLPTFKLELNLGGLVAGVDEAGCGPLVGPVVAAAVILNPDTLPEGIDDSKKLSAAKRELLFESITARALSFAIAQASAEEIDRINILQASMLAMRRAVEKLTLAPAHCLIDGNRLPDAISYPATAIIGGDAKSLSIAAASIMAKVTRDRLMADLARDYPHYGWERNAGYPTAEHLAALGRYGVTPHHRRSFAPVKQLLPSG